jgi:hypothetical protein
MPKRPARLMTGTERRFGSAGSSGPVRLGYRRLCLLEATPIRMATKDTRTKTYRILAAVGVFHHAIREIERVPQMPSQTSFRIWKTPLVADRVVGHAPNPCCQDAVNAGGVAVEPIR